MSKQNEFQRITGWLDELNSAIEHAESDNRSTRNVLESLEYELQQLQRQIRSPAREAGHAAPVTLGRGAAAAAEEFSQKLRHPESLKHGWWAFLGSAQ